MVIRPLNESEKEFLNKFYAETIVTDFLHDPELKRLHCKKKSYINNNYISNLRNEINTLREFPESNQKRINELKSIIKTTKEQNADLYYEEINEIEEKMTEVREVALLYPDKEDHKQFYGANNARNNCLYNKIKSMGQLINFEPDYDNLFCSLKNRLYELGYDDCEDYLISQLERYYYEEEEDRLLQVNREEKLKK